MIPIPRLGQMTQKNTPLDTISKGVGDEINIEDQNILGWNSG